MSESTTVQIDGCLGRLGSDTAARDELITLAHERLRDLTSRLLGGFPRVRKHFEDTTGVLNEAYLKLHRSVGEVKPPTTREFLGLASLEIRRILLDQIRKLIGRGETPHPAPVSLSQLGNRDGTGGFEPPIHDREREHLELVSDLLEAVNALPEELREVVHLLFYQSLTQPEAAALLGVHKDTVKRRWAEARIRLAEKLDAFDVG